MRKAYFVYLTILSIFGNGLFAQTTNDSLPLAPLRVGFILEPPFVMQDGNHYKGVSIDLAEDIGIELERDIEYKRYEHVEHLISGIESYEYDICINPSSPNLDLMDKVDFTHPFMVSNLAIGIRAKEQSVLMKLIHNVFSWSFLTGLSFVVCVILIFGGLTWFFERKRNTNHFPNNRKGVWEAFWWSAVTMTTVGYGDKAPRTTGGRITAMVWMFTAVIIISSYTASVASLLTVNELTLDINSLDDLRKSKIAVLRNNTGEQFLRLSRIPYVTVDDISEGLDFVLDGKADALLHDETSMEHLIEEKDIEDMILIAPAKYSNKFYGFAMPRNHPLFDNVNESIIKVTNSIEWKLERGSRRMK